MKKQENKGKQGKTLRAVCHLFRRSFSWRPAYLLLCIGRIGVETLLPIPAILFPAWIIQALLSGSGSHPSEYLLFGRVLALVLGMVGSSLLFRLLDIETRRRLTLLQSSLKDWLHRELSRKQRELPLAQLEQVEYRELFVRANSAISGDINYAVRSLGGDRGVDAIGTETVRLVSGILRSAVLIAALVRLNVVMALALIVVLCFHMFGGSREKRASYAERLKTVPYRNKNQYVTNVMIDFRFAKEIRLYGAEGFLMKKFQENKQHFYKAREEAKPAFYLANLLGAAGELVQLAATYGYLTVQVLRGTISLGGFTGYAAAIRNLSETLVSVVQAYLNLMLYGEYLTDLEMALQLEGENGKETAEKEVIGNKIPAVRGTELILEQVSFSYPGSSVRVFDRFSLTLPLAGSISLVGPNGSGKSTFIKLLLRLYEPDEGRILLDGVDIQTIPLAEYRKKMAAVFQDYAIFAWSIRENVTPVAGDDAAVWGSLGQAGLKDRIERLPQGLETKLFRHYHPEGVDMSGGEKQKLAIARMLYLDTPLLILDEPTAALDPRAELAIYEQIHQLSGKKTVLYISHRMSSCQFCDTILVLNQGKVVEQGTHAELMACQGLYHQMYQSQAEGYGLGKEEAAG